MAIAELVTDDNYSEERYLALNTDVAEAVSAGGGAFTADGDTQITPTTPILLDQATGDEIGLGLSLTVNKAASGNYTAIKCDVTETAAPGSADLSEQ